MSTDLTRHVLNGATMDTRWSAQFYAAQSLDPAPIRAALQASVAEVDAQMSTWSRDSDLMRLNAAPVDEWQAVPAQLFEVLRLGLEIGRSSEGAFDIGMGDAVTAWGFGPDAASPERIRTAMTAPRARGEARLVLDAGKGRVRKTAPIALDLSGIAKGYGVDRLAETLCGFGVVSGLVGIDGEMRALGSKPDHSPWTLAVEAPDRARRTPHSILTLENAAVATSGDYRHWVEVQGRCLSHTMDPRRGAPLTTSPASVTVVARTCAEADAWATALMVLGPDRGAALARQRGFDALFLLRDEAGGVQSVEVGRLFSDRTEAIAP